MRARLFVLVACVLALAVLLVAKDARAAAPEMRTTISADTVAVGDVVQLQLQAMTQGMDRPSGPRPGNTSGFSLRGTSQSPTSQTIIVNGVRTDKSGVTATWNLRADRIGTFTIGPPTVGVGGKRYAGQAARIVVVPAGQAPPRNQGGAVDPMDPWKGMFQFDFGNGPDREEEPRVATDPKLALDAPRGSTAFLHATLDKAKAVVGEQVTLSVLLYTDAMEREPDFTDVHEATAGEFLKRSLLDNDAQARFLGNALVAGRLYNVKLIRKSALFPLKTGWLEVGPMALSLARSRGENKRESEVLHVDVVEPPLAGRPPGYAVGDVGHFELSSEVTPREIDRGGAVGVTIELSGSGNLPAQLNVPTRTGVEWLTPETHDKLGAIRGTDRLGGKRTFAYVVRVQTAGDVDLGDVQASYYDPDARTYGIAKVKLGTIHVNGTGAAPTPEDTIDILPGLPDARVSLAAVRAPTRKLGDTWLFWLGLVLGPLAYPLFAGAREIARSYGMKRAERAADPKTEMNARIADADVKSRHDDARAIDAAAARAIEASASACLDVSLRAAAGDAAEADLEEAGLANAEARALAEVYRACQAARFSPEVTPAADAKARWAAARPILKRLDKTPRMGVA